MTRNSLALLTLLFCTSADATYWQEIIDQEVRTSSAHFGDGTGQIIVIIDKGWWNVDHPWVVPVLPRYLDGYYDACVSHANASQINPCDGITQGDQAANATRTVSSTNKKLYQTEDSGSTTMSWHGDLMSRVANYVAPGAKFILIKAGYFYAPNANHDWCEKKSGGLPDWCWGLQTDEITAALQYINDMLINPDEAGLNPHNITVLLSMGTWVGRVTSCPTSNPQLNDLYAQYQSLDSQGVAVHVSAGNFYYDNGFPKNGHGTDAYACHWSVFANGGYWSDDGSRHWASGSGANVYAVSRYDDWDFQMDLGVLYNNFEGTSLSNAAAAGYWALLRSDPRYGGYFFPARIAEGIQLRGLFEEDVPESTPGISQSVMATETGKYARYYDAEQATRLNDALGNKDRVESGDPITGHALPYSGYSYGDYTYFCYVPTGTTGLYTYNYEPGEGTHIQFPGTYWDWWFDMPVNPVPPHQPIWDSFEDGWWFELPTTAWATDQPDRVQLSFFRLTAWGFLPELDGHYLDYSPCGGE